MAKKNFVYPSTRSYPIMDKAHARKALQMAAKPSTRGSYSTVKRAVCAKHPGMPACKATSGRRPARQR